MSLEVTTKDCTALSDAELAEMGDMCAIAPSGWDIGVLSKQREEWVLVTQARSDAGDLEGFCFSTLERIGGTPSVLIGIASVRRSPARTEVLAGVLADQFHRALMAFPDEDVLVGTRFAEPAGFESFSSVIVLEDVVPRPGHKASGEERAWGRRLAKRFGVDADYDDRGFVTRGDSTPPCVLDHGSDERATDADITALFVGVDRQRGDTLIAFGWAMAEDLAALPKP